MITLNRFRIPLLASLIAIFALLPIAENTASASSTPVLISIQGDLYEGATLAGSISGLNCIGCTVSYRWLESKLSTNGVKTLTVLKAYSSNSSYVATSQNVGSKLVLEVRVKAKRISLTYRSSESGIVRSVSDMPNLIAQDDDSSDSSDSSLDSGK